MNGMIYLGYDVMRQQTLAFHNGRTIVCQESDRATEILNGLVHVGEQLPPNRPIPYDDGGDDVEVVLLTRTPWMYKVEYSDQAWEDLLSVAIEREHAE